MTFLVDHPILTFVVTVVVLWRNVAIVNAFIVGLCILAFTPLWSLYTLDMRHLYSGYVIWGRSLVRLVLAALLFYLRPREGTANQT